MEIVEQRQGAVAVLKPVGPLCLEDADEFRGRLREAVQQHLGRIVLDASAMAYVDSKGLEALYELADSLGQSGQALKMCYANDTLREALDLTNLLPMFDLYEDINGAVRSFL